MSEDTRGKGKGDIVLIDDDTFLLSMYASKFTQAGFTTHPYPSTSEALKAIRDGLEPQAILFDMIMPEGDGLFFVDALRKEDLAKDAIKIALSNANDESLASKLAQQGVARYIVKASMIPSEVVSSVVEEMQKRKK